MWCLRRPGTRKHQLITSSEYFLITTAWYFSMYNDCGQNMCKDTGCLSSKTMVLCSVHFAPECFWRLGGQSSKEVLAFGNNGGSKISCCFFRDILKLFWNSQSLHCLLWRAQVFCTTNDTTWSQTLVSCFSWYRPYFYQ